MTNPLISIIIPNYNHSKFLKQRLESVFNQTFQDFEVLLLDDASRDDSIEIFNTYKNHPKVSEFLVNKTNSGSPFKQWQKGIELAKGTYIWIAESDDYCEPTFLEKLMHQFKENPLLGLVYCQTIDVDEKGNTLLHRIVYTNRFQPNIWETDFVIDGKEFVINYLFEFNVIPNASAVVFKKSLVTLSVFTSELLQMKMCGDWFFWIQVCLKTQVGFIEEALNCFRNHESISRNHSTNERKKRRLLEEASVRSFMQSVDIDNKKTVDSLYKSWFQIHGKKDFLSKSFYQVKLKGTSIGAFLLTALRNKLN